MRTRAGIGFRHLLDAARTAIDAGIVAQHIETRHGPVGFVEQPPAQRRAFDMSACTACLAAAFVIAATTRSAPARLLA